MVSGVWWLLARVKFPGTTMGSTGKMCDPRAWRKTPTLQTSLNCSVIKHDFISPSSPLLPRIMKLHLNWGVLGSTSSSILDVARWQWHGHREQ